MHFICLQVQWSPHNETILASSGTDRRLNVWDLRWLFTLTPGFIFFKEQNIFYNQSHCC